MTTVINGTTAKFYINNPPSIDSNADLVIKSQYSQKIVLTIAADDWSFGASNARYDEIIATVPATFKDEHQNGYYTWTIGNYSNIVKIITQPGGGAGEVEYISNNENREADVYFRPNY
jgi:hypothetical protein